MSKYRTIPAHRSAARTWSWASLPAWVGADPDVTVLRTVFMGEKAKCTWILAWTSDVVTIPARTVAIPPRAPRPTGTRLAMLRTLAGTRRLTDGEVYGDAPAATFRYVAPDGARHAVAIPARGVDTVPGIPARAGETDPLSAWHGANDAHVPPPVATQAKTWTIPATGDGSAAARLTLRTGEGGRHVVTASLPYPPDGVMDGGHYYPDRVRPDTAVTRLHVVGGGTLGKDAPRPPLHASTVRSARAGTWNEGSAATQYVDGRDTCPMGETPGGGRTTWTDGGTVAIGRTGSKPDAMRAERALRYGRPPVILPAAYAILPAASTVHGRTVAYLTIGGKVTGATGGTAAQRAGAARAAAARSAAAAAARLASGKAPARRTATVAPSSAAFLARIGR